MPCPRDRFAIREWTTVEPHRRTGPNGTLISLQERSGCRRRLTLFLFSRPPVDAFCSKRQAAGTNNQMQKTALAALVLIAAAVNQPPAPAVLQIGRASCR